MAHAKGSPLNGKLFHTNSSGEPFGRSNQWAELRAVWLVVINEPSSIFICTDSWAVFKVLTLWLEQWHAQDCTITTDPCGDKSCRLTYGCCTD